jgi:hypothetical protein
VAVLATDALVAIGVEPAARSEDKKKRPTPLLKRRLKVRRKSEGRRRT